MNRSTSLGPVIGGLLLVVSLGCTPEPYDTVWPAGRSVMEWVEGDLVGEPRTELPILDELVLYIDYSNSMQGYVRPRGSEFSQVLRRLDTFAANLQPRHGVSFRTIGETVAPADADIDRLAQLAQNPDEFQETQSAIADAIRSFDDAFRLERNETTGVPRCHVLVTDGVQYAAPSAGTGCQGGNDPECVNEEIRLLIANGWGVHVFAVRSRFSGQIWQHSRAVPGRQVPSSYYGVKGGDHDDYRPFLVILFTTEASFVEHVADSLRKDLKEIGLGEELVKEIPLTVRLVEATRVAVHTSYEVSETESPEGEEFFGDPNPLVETVGLNRREILAGPQKGQQLPEWVRKVRYQHYDAFEASLAPFALGLEAELELTPAGRAWFGEESVGAASIMKALSVRSVDPPSWLQRGAEEVGEMSEDKPEEEGAEDVEDEEPEEPAEPKVLDFLTGGDAFVGLDDSRMVSQFRLTGEAAIAAGDKIRHLPMRWSNVGDYVPFALLRIDGELDPERFGLPAWVAEWSTPDDSSIKSFNRILNLDRLFKSLQANGHLERQGMQPVYVFIEPELLQ